MPPPLDQSASGQRTTAEPLNDRIPIDLGDRHQPQPLEKPSPEPPKPPLHHQRRWIRRARLQLSLSDSKELSSERIRACDRAMNSSAIQIRVGTRYATASQVHTKRSSSPCTSPGLVQHYWFWTNPKWSNSVQYYSKNNSKAFQNIFGLSGCRSEVILKI